MANGNFTEGKILSPLLKFTLPVLAALFLQSLYGAVDLLVVGQFATSADVSAVSTGSQLMSVITNTIAGLAMGTTVLIGQQIGKGEKENAGRTMGVSIAFFLFLAVVLAALIMLNVEHLARIMQAPQEAFSATCDYIRICGFGLIFIILYNLIGSLFRGIGNSRVPLMTVAIAAVINIFGDLLLVNVFHMGAAGAAWATIASQAISVLISFLIIRKTEMPFTFHMKMVRLDWHRVKEIVSLGIPIALSDFLVGISFLVIIAIVNTLGVTASAGVGVAEKVCGFIMLVPSAFSQAMAAFVAQNYGANRMDRARKAMSYGIFVSLGIGAVMAWFSFFHGEVLCRLFSADPKVVTAGADYLKAYAIDCLITPFFFNMAGFFNGCGHTKIVMAENIIGGICVRLPLAYLFARIQPVSLFRIALATPSASIIQTIICTIYLFKVFGTAKKTEQAAA